MKQCKGEGQSICKRCWEIGLTTAAQWKACDLYMVDGYEGQYCYEHAKELEESLSKGKIMNREEILQEIQKTEEHLANMKKLLEDGDYDRWKPKAEGVYWYVNSRGEICCSHFCPIYKTDIARYQTFNCFQTREQCEAEADKILVRRKLEDIARRLNKGKEIDWNDHKYYKYAICFNFDKNEIDYLYCSSQKEQGVVYCLSNKFSRVAIQEIGEQRLRKYLIGE